MTMLKTMMMSTTTTAATATATTTATTALAAAIAVCSLLWRMTATATTATVMATTATVMATTATATTPFNRKARGGGQCHGWRPFFFFCFVFNLQQGYLLLIGLTILLFLRVSSFF